MTQDRARSQVMRMFASIAKRYDLTNTVLSFGMHFIWRRILVRMLKPQKDWNCIDICSGTGDLLPHIRKRFGQVWGSDFCAPMLDGAKKKFGAEYDDRLIQADALNMPFADQVFDLASVAFGVRNFENLSQGLIEIRRILKKQGYLLVLEFGQPKGAIFGPCFRLYSQVIIPLVGGIITGNFEAYRYLPQTSKDFPSDQAFADVLEQAGYSVQKIRPLTFGVAYAYLAQVKARGND